MFVSSIYAKKDNLFFSIETKIKPKKVTHKTAVQYFNRPSITICALSIVSLTVMCLCMALPFVTIKHVFCHNIYHTVLTLPTRFSFYSH